MVGTVILWILCVANLAVSLTSAIDGNYRAAAIGAFVAILCAFVALSRAHAARRTW